MSEVLDVSSNLPAALPAPGSVRAWVLAARPATLTAAAAPVAIGTACAAAAGGFRAGPAIGALAGAMLLQVGANFANDVFDYEKGADDERRLGPVRAVQAGLLSPRAVRIGMVVCFVLAFAIGIYLATIAGPVVVGIGLSSIVCAVAYTGGPYPLAYHGLGELFVMLFFGFAAVCGTCFVQLGRVTGAAVVASIATGALACAILTVNNLRDRETDVRAGKRTLAVRLGRRGAIAEYVGLLVVAYAAPAAMVAAGLASPWALLPLGTAPIALAIARRVATESGRALNARLVATAKLLFVHGVLLAIGIALH